MFNSVSFFLYLNSFLGMSLSDLSLAHFVYICCTSTDISGTLRKHDGDDKFFWAVFVLNSVSFLSLNSSSGISIFDLPLADFLYICCTYTNSLRTLRKHDCDDNED